MKLIDLIKSVDLEKVYLYISKMDEDGTESDIKDVRRCYGKTVEEMLSNTTVATTDVILVKNAVDWYYDYLIENPEETKKTTDVKYLPDGTLDKNHYTYININLKDSSGEETGIGNQPWAELISMEIENTVGLSNEALLGEILWEITFHGFSEIKVKNFWEDLSRNVPQ